MSLWAPFSIFLFIISYSKQIKDLLVIRLHRPLIIRFSGQTPARLTHYLIHYHQEQSSLKSSSPIINLNEQLWEQNHKRLVFKTNPLYISFEETQSHLGNTYVKIGAQNPQTGQWNSKDLILTGRLSLSSDIPLGPGRDIRVKWVSEDGDRHVPGQVIINWQQSQYHVPIPEKRGTVVAELVEHDGSVIGKSSIKINELQFFNHFDRHLEIKPSSRELAFYQWFEAVGFPLSSIKNEKNSSNRSSTQQRNKDRNIVYDHNKQNNHPSEKILSHSIFINEIQEDNYAPLSFINNTNNVLPKIKSKDFESYIKWLKLLLDQSHLKLYNHLQSLHIGKATSRGFPIKEVKIDSLDSKVKIFYLNNMLIPDPNLKSTQSNGFFMVVAPKPGLYGLNIYLENENKTFYTEAFVPQEGYSYQNYELVEKSKEKTARIFDLFTYEEKSAQILGSSPSEDVFIRGSGKVTTKFNYLNRSYLYLEETEDYLGANYLVTLEDEELLFPRIPKIWLEKFLYQNKISINGNQGGILGVFKQNVKTINFKVTEFESLADSVYFFDPTGKIIDHPVKHGGFILAPLNPNELIEVEIRLSDDEQKIIHNLWSIEPKEWLVINMEAL